MADFRIISQTTKSFMRFADTTVDTGLVGGTGIVKAATSRGIINPLNVLTYGELFNPTLFTRTATRIIKPSAALDDAVRGLHELGDRHGIVGIMLGPNPAHHGLVMLRGDIGYGSSTALIQRVGRNALMDIDAAARRVMDFVNATG